MSSSGHGAALFAFFAGMAESETRVHPGEVALGARARTPRGRPKVFEDDMAAHARSLRARGVSVPEIAAKLVIPAGRNKGRHPSLASVYRVPAEDAGPGLGA
ncbi:hypothetical protein ABZ897_60210 [Nonomuraea sp. NPDC046802]|uniref:hypothetical protein n=1 Tax=Nonomuraea sp. NPDC046802 TaxID=3154919 RepID=UPI0033ED6DC4